MVKSKDIKDITQVHSILAKLRKYYLNVVVSYDTDTPRYQNECEEISEQVNRIEQYILGGKMFEPDSEIADDRMTAYWKYIKNQLSFDDLLKTIKQFSSEILV